MPFYRAQVSIPNDSALAKDVSVNTWHFEADGIGTRENQMNDITNALAEFYTAIMGSLSENCGSPARVRIYDLEDAPPRTPQHDSSGIIIQPSATAPFPGEIAAVMSFRGDETSGVRRARNRGRVYVGPLSSVTTADQAGDVRFTATFMTTLRFAARDAFMPVATPLSGALIEWSVFSRANALGLAVGAPAPANEPQYTPVQLGLGFRPVRHVWVDNAVDIQRRRGTTATLRETIDHP